MPPIGKCDACNQEITDETLSLRTHNAGFPGSQLCEPCLRKAIVAKAAPKLLEGCKAALEHIRAEGGYDRGRNKKLYGQLMDAILSACE